MTRHPWLFPVTLAAVCSTAVPSHAAGYPKEGRIDTTECLVSEGPRTESATGAVFGSFVTHNVARSAAPNPGPLDEYGTYCVGHYLEVKEGKSYADGVCEQTDRDGDKWVVRFHDEGNQMAGTLDFVAGTGKYAGARISGKYRPAGPLFSGSPGRMQTCIHVTGTYRLK